MESVGVRDTTGPVVGIKNIFGEVEFWKQPETENMKIIPSAVSERRQICVKEKLPLR
jgi:hypothetical protein